MTAQSQYPTEIQSYIYDTTTKFFASLPEDHRQFIIDRNEAILKAYTKSLNDDKSMTRCGHMYLAWKDGELLEFVPYEETLSAIKSWLVREANYKWFSDPVPSLWMLRQEYLGK